MHTRLDKKNSSDRALFKNLKGRVSFSVPMAGYTTMRVGGKARALYQPQGLSGLIEAVRLCKRKGISFLAIGRGSNIIINDKGTDKFIIRLAAPFFRRIEACQGRISCGAGVLLNELCRFAEENSLGGTEFLVGIPGTVGGAIMQNAGAHDSSISDILRDVKVLDAGCKIRILPKERINFGYRYCSLSREAIIIGATFLLKRRDKKDIREDISRYIEKRLASQDYTAASAGCIFKNPANSRMGAGELIERCGLKGINIGGAYVSQRHANFIINKKKASAEDILRLIKLIKDKVYKRFGVSLKEEVLII